MLTRQFLIGCCLLCATPLCVGAEDIAVTGSLKIKGTTYKFTSVRAFRITSEGKDAVAVILSPEPVQLLNPYLFPRKEKRWISLLTIEGGPHVQAIYDTKTGEFISFQGWARDRTFIGRDQVGFRGKAKIDGNITSGKGESKNLLGDDRDQSFEFTFTAPLEHIDLPQQDVAILSTPPSIPAISFVPNKEFEESGIPPSPK